MIINNNYAPQGWQCPICKRVYSPTTQMCMYCGGELKTTITTSSDTARETFGPGFIMKCMNEFVKEERNTILQNRLEDYPWEKEEDNEEDNEVN